MKNTVKLFAAFAILAAINACDSASGNLVGVPCEIDTDCMGLVCVNNVCIDKCTPDSCDHGQICNERGLCETAANTPVSVECSELNPCKDGKVCVSGKCIDNSECSELNSCKDGKICHKNKCIERCTPSSCAAGKVCDFSGICIDKCTETSCGPDAICMNGYCIAKCTETSCSEGEFCGADGICTTKCTPTSCSESQVCSNSGKCVDKCKAGSCPENQVCGESGNCIFGECSEVDSCPNDQICSQNKCYTVQTLTCYEDSDCGEGFGCDKKKCVDENSCSMTRTCPEDKVCRDKKCSEPIEVTCDSTHKCADPTKTCVEGKCVTCSCAENEKCIGDSQCMPAQKAGEYSEGDPCVWTADFNHCIDNQIVSCSTPMGQNDYRIHISNCGAKICAETSDELGANCHEPCANEGDFQGQCIEISEDIYEFTQVCEKTKDDKLVWTLTNGFQHCLAGCTNGRCNFVPEEFGESCTDAGYPDACQGNWLTYCYYSHKMGTACSTYSAEHFCALPGPEALKRQPGLIGNCALPCQNAGKTRKGCIQDEEGAVYSMNYLCAETADGKLAEFEAGYINCKNGCNLDSGECI